jgi:phosphodiesterase/alkaline phosphatase D-like protein
MIRIFLTSLLLMLPSVSSSGVYFYNGIWVGDICMSYNGVWSRVAPQPLGSFCQIMLPTGMVVQGQIVNM